MITSNPCLLYTSSRHHTDIGESNIIKRHIILDIRPFHLFHAEHAFKIDNMREHNKRNYMGRRQGIALGRDVYFYSSLRLFGQRYMQKKRMDNFYYHRFNPALNIILYKNFQYRNERSAVYNHSAELSLIHIFIGDSRFNVRGFVPKAISLCDGRDSFDSDNTGI